MVVCQETKEKRETGVVGLLPSATRAHSRPHAEEKEPMDPESYFDSLKTARANGQHVVFVISPAA
jgi:hypothetical protein